MIDDYLSGRRGQSHKRKSSNGRKPMTAFQITDQVVASCKKDRTGVKLGDTWFSGREVLQVNKGDTVSLQYTENGNFKNIVAGSFQVTAKGQYSGGSGGNSGGGYKKSSSGSNKNSVDYEAGITAGAAINNASLLLAHGIVVAPEGITHADVIGRLATEIARESIKLKKLIGRALAGGNSTPQQVQPAKQPAPAQAAPTPVQQPAPVQQPPAKFDDFDDDIPF